MTTEKRQRNGVPGAVQRPRAEALYKSQSADRARTRFVTIDHVVFEVHNASVSPSVYMTKVIHSARSTAKPPPEPRVNLLPPLTSSLAIDDELDATAKPLTVALLDAPHQLPEQVPADVLELVLKYCYFHTSKEKDEKNGTQVRDWDDDFVRMDPRRLCELASAAYYLEVPPLVELTCRAIANIISGKDPDQIRDTFQIENDLLQRFMPYDTNGYASARRASASARAAQRRQNFPPLPQPAKKQSNYSLSAIDDVDNPDSDDNPASQQLCNRTVSELADWINSSDSNKRNGKKRKKKRNKQKTPSEPNGLPPSSQNEIANGTRERDDPSRSNLGNATATIKPPTQSIANGSREPRLSSDDDVVFVSETPASRSTQHAASLGFMGASQQKSAVPTSAIPQSASSVDPPEQLYTDLLPDYASISSKSDGSNDPDESFDALIEDPLHSRGALTGVTLEQEAHDSSLHVTVGPGQTTNANAVSSSSVQELGKGANQFNSLDPTSDIQDKMITDENEGESVERSKYKSELPNGHEKGMLRLQQRTEIERESGIEPGSEPRISRSLCNLSMEGRKQYGSVSTREGSDSSILSSGHEPPKLGASDRSNVKSDHMASSTNGCFSGSERLRLGSGSGSQNPGASAQGPLGLVNLDNTSKTDAKPWMSSRKPGENQSEAITANGRTEGGNLSGEAIGGTSECNPISPSLGGSLPPFIKCPESMNREVADFEKRLNANASSSFDRVLAIRGQGSRSVGANGNGANEESGGNVHRKVKESQGSEEKERDLPPDGQRNEARTGEASEWKRKMDEAVLRERLKRLEELAKVYLDEMNEQQTEREQIREDLGQVRIASEQLAETLRKTTAGNRADLRLEQAKLGAREDVLTEMAERISKKLGSLHKQRENVLDRVWEVDKKMSNLGSVREDVGAAQSLG